MAEKDKKAKPTFAEMVAQYTGVPLEEIEDKPGMTEEQSKQMWENIQKDKSLSREERLKKLHDWVDRENEKGIS